MTVLDRWLRTRGYTSGPLFPSERGSPTNPTNRRLKSGGVGQMISAWLSGDVELEPDRLVDQLALIIDRLTDPKLG